MKKFEIRLKSENLHPWSTGQKSFILDTGLERIFAGLRVYQYRNFPPNLYIVSCLELPNNVNKLQTDSGNICPQSIPVVQGVAQLPSHILDKTCPPWSASPGKACHLDLDCCTSMTCPWSGKYRTII